MHKKTMTIVLTIFALLVIGLFLSPSALATTATAADFSVQPVNRSTVCWKCHTEFKLNFTGIGVKVVYTPSGYFNLTTDPVNLTATEVHANHTEDVGGKHTNCYVCHLAPDCRACHEIVAHEPHGSVSEPVLTVCNGTSQYVDLITCANSLCHNQIPSPNLAPACANCHVAHVTTTNMTDCMGPGCHVSEDLTEEHAYRDLNCSTCHESTNETVISAIELGYTNCSACHIFEPHGYDATMHTATNASVDCTNCHYVELKPEHDKPSSSSCGKDCSNCHPTPRNSFEIWEESCSQGDCHPTKHTEQDAKHQAITAANCADCHVSDISAVHSEIGCNINGCHDQSTVPTEKDCVVCHDDQKYLESHGYNVVKHTSTTADCIYCHNSNLSITHTHKGGCEVCHANSDVTINTADCYSCHPSMPHDYSCILCHGSKYDPDDYSRECAKMHKKHDDKALCGDCHAIPASTTLESSGEYCAICHGSPERYDQNDVADDVHMEHAEMDIGESGDFCYWCHGLDVPDITPETSCNNCHRGESYDGDSRRIHKKHGDEISCVGCHGPDAVLDVNPKDQCYICHSYEDYSSTYKLHDEHMGKGWCDACHGSNIPVDQDCVKCHDRTPSYYSSRAIHKEHAGTKYPCVTCHVEYTPIGVVPEPTPTPTPTQYGTITGTVTDSSEPIEGVTVSTDGHSTATASDGTYTLSDVAAGDYTVTASKSGYESQSKSVTIGPGDTVTVDFALTTAPPSIGKGYILSKNADYSTQDTTYTRSDTIYVKIWSDRIDYRDMERAEFEIKDVCRIRLTNNYDGTFTAHYDLSRARTGERDVRIRIEDDHDNKYEVQTKIYIKW